MSGTRRRVAGAVSELLRWRLTLLLLATVVVTLGLLGVLAAEAFERAVEPELDRRARLVASIVRADLQRAAELGLDLGGVADLGAHLERARAPFEELRHLAVVRADGSPVAAAGRADEAGRVHRLPVLDGNRTIGEVVVTLDPAFAKARLRELLLTVMTVGVVAAVIAAELAMRLLRVVAVRPLTELEAVAARQRRGDFRDRVVGGGLPLLSALAARLDQQASDLATRAAAMAADRRAAWLGRHRLTMADGAPQPWRPADVADVRLPLLLFTIGAEVAVAVLPVHARDLVRPEGWSPALAAALPIAGFVLAMLGAMPLAAAAVRARGARLAFLAAAPLAALALLGMASASHVFGLAAARALLALPYALALVACQDYALGAARAGERAAAAATFGGVVAAGVLCGAGLGGLLAERLSVTWAIAAGAVAVVGAAAVAAPLMRHGAPAVGMAAVDPGDRRATRVPGAALCLGLGLPMSVATAVLVWYLVPLLLSGAGSAPGEVARVVMLYYLATVLVGPLLPALAERGAPAARGTITLQVGAALAALALWPLGWRQDFWWIVAGVGGLGVGHALMRAPLVALASGQPRLLDRLRVSERLGAAIGLAAGSLAWPVLGAGPVLQALALLCTVGAVVGAWALRRSKEVLD